MAERKPVSMTLTDRVVNYFNPESGLKRVQARFVMDNLSNAGFVTPGSTKRAMRGWLVRSNSADADITPKLDKSRAGSRDLFMNTPLAAGALRRAKTNVIGPGLTLQSRVDRAYLTDLFGFADEEFDKWEMNTEREFRLWASSKECDAQETLNFYELQSLAYFSALLSGDVFILMPFLDKFDSPYELTLRLIESDQVSNPKGLGDTDKIVGGVEINSLGAPRAYHVRNQHPGKRTLNMASLEWTRIPVRGRSGRLNALHLFRMERPGQHRGVPFLAHVMEKLKQSTRLSDSELMSALLASYFTVFISTQNPSNPLAGGYTPDVNPELGGTVLNTEQLASDEKLYEMGSGNIIGLGENQRVDIADAKRPNASFAPFFEAIVKEFSAGIEMPYEQVMLHFSNSYSASRAEMLEAWKFFRGDRTWCVRNLCEPVYQEWLTEAIIKGRIVAPGFFDDPAIRAAWCGSKWVGPGQGQIDPMKETKAALERIKGNLSTHEDEYSAIHPEGDWDSAVDRRGREEKRLTKAGLLSVQEELKKPEPPDGPPGSKPGKDKKENQDDGKD